MPRPQSWVEEHFGELAWTESTRQRGLVDIGGDWILHNLARIEPPFPLRDGGGRSIHQITCHALIADQLEAALVDLKDASLTHLINSFDGCWVPRHMNWNPTSPLSRHSWGIAVDVNARRFPYGSTDKQDPRLVAAFRRHGFEAGQDWRPKADPMHFEIVTLPTPLDQEGMKIVVNDELVSRCGRLVDGIPEGPLQPVVEALGGTLTPHPEQRKLYIYSQPNGGATPRKEGDAA